MPMDVANLWHLRRNSLFKKRQRAQPSDEYRRKARLSTSPRHQQSGFQRRRLQPPKSIRTCSCSLWLPCRAGSVRPAGEHEKGAVMLYEFVVENRDELIRRCRVKVEMRSIPPPTPAELKFGVPRFLDQLVEALL